MRSVPASQKILERASFVPHWFRVSFQTSFTHLGLFRVMVTLVSCLRDLLLFKLLAILFSPQLPRITGTTPSESWCVLSTAFCNKKMLSLPLVEQWKECVNRISLRYPDKEEEISLAGTLVILALDKVEI